MTVSFKGEYVSFWIRLFKKLAPIVLILGFLFLKVRYGMTFSGELAGSRIYFYIFMVACFFFGLYYHIRDIRTVVTEVRFINDQFQVVGYDFNTTFEDTLPIDKTFVEIKLKKGSKAKPYLEIMSEDKYYYVNSYSDWKKETLMELVTEYRIRSKNVVFGLDYFPELVKNQS